MRERRSLTNSALLLTATLIVTIMVSGCFDYREEIWINSDRTGSITMDVTIGEMFVDLYEQSGSNADLLSEDGIRKKLSSKNGITLVSLNIFTAEENRRIQLTMKFSSIEALDTLFKDPEAARFLGTIGVADGKGGINYTRTIALADSVVKGLALYDEKRSNRFWVSKVHFPGYITSSNAPEKNIDEKTNSIIIWGYAIDVLLQEPREMEAVYSSGKGLKIVPLLLAGFVFIAVLLGLYKILGTGPAQPRRQ